MRTLLVALLVVASTAGVAAPTAAAKEIEVDIRSQPAGTQAGKPWTAVFALTAKADGQTFPIEGAPVGVEIRNQETGERRYFAARATLEPGVYRVRVVFPAPGLWSYEITDGMEIRAEFPPVSIASPSRGSTASPDRFPVWPVAGGVLLALALAGAAAFLLVRYRPGILSSRPQ